MEKDLGVTFQNNLKFDKHITLSVNKSHSILGVIKRSFDMVFREGDVLDAV